MTDPNKTNNPKAIFDNPPSDVPYANPDLQTAHAATYIAHQLFYIRVALDRIAERLKKH
jgi:hypothetical protein